VRNKAEQVYVVCEIDHLVLTYPAKVLVRFCVVHSFPGLFCRRAECQAERTYVQSGRFIHRLTVISRCSNGVLSGKLRQRRDVASKERTRDEEQ
jgi:hypothetical protein